MTRDWQNGLKYDPTIQYLQETHFQYNNTGRMKVKWPQQIYQANIKGKKVRGAIWTEDKLDFRTKTFTGDKEGHYLIMKESTYKGDRDAKWVCTTKQRGKICKAKTDRTERRKTQNPQL